MMCLVFGSVLWERLFYAEIALQPLRCYPDFITSNSLPALVAVIS
jgi:hypothetical protein